MAEQKKYISDKTGAQLDTAIGKVLNIEETLSGTAGTIPSSAAVKNYVDGKSVDTESTLSGDADKIPTSKAVSDALGSVSSFSIDFTNYGTARYINTDTQLINKVKLINTGEAKLWVDGVVVLTIPAQEQSDTGTMYTYTLPTPYTIEAGHEVWWTIARDADNLTTRILSIY